MSPAANPGAGGPGALGSETPIRDRLVTTLFLAAVVHGMVILGVTFSARLGPRTAAPGLDVQLLAEDAQDEPREGEAAYLAQASRVGAGTTRERIAARTPLGLPPDPQPTDGSTADAPPGEVGDAARLDDRAQLRPARGLVGIGQRGQRRGHADLVAVGQADALRAVIDAQAAHDAQRNFFFAGSAFRRSISVLISWARSFGHTSVASSVCTTTRSLTPTTPVR